MGDSSTMTDTTEAKKGEDYLGFGSLNATDRQLRQNQIQPLAGGGKPDRQEVQKKQKLQNTVGTIPYAVSCQGKFLNIAF